MVKYLGPRLRITRRLGALEGFTNKYLKNRILTPGQHGKIVTLKRKRSSLSDDYKKRLIEKQKLRFNYGISEKQLFSYYKQAKKLRGSTGINLLELIESRLDCIVYRLGFAPTISAARQIINHGHILVNEGSVNIPSFLCSIGDIIKIKNNVCSVSLISKFVKEYSDKRILIKDKIKNYKKVKKTGFKSQLLKNFYRILTPKHLNIDINNLKGQVISAVNRNNILANINVLRIIEYYSK